MRRVALAVIVCVSLPLHAETGATPVASGTDVFLDNAELVIEGALATAEPKAEAAGGASVEPLALTVDRCAELALSQNAQAFIAEAKAVAARERVGQAKSARYPQVASHLTGAYVDGMPSHVGNGVLTNLIVGKNLIGSKESATFDVEAKQVLYAGGQIAAAIRAAEFLAQSEEWQREVALDTLVFQAKQAYYDCLLTQALLRVAEDSVTTFERHLADAQQAFDVGLIGTFEVLRAKTELGKRKSDAIAAENAKQLALVNLCRLLAIDQSSPIKFEGKLDWVPLDAQVEDLIAEALANRAELKALDQGLAAAEANVTRLRGQYRPNVAASAKWSHMDGASKVYPNGLTLGVGAEWDLYSGGKRKHDVAGAEAERDQIEYQQDEARRLVELDVRQAYIQVDNAIATIRRNKGTVDLGLEGQRLAELRFQEGVGTQGETLDADLALTAAETSLVQALRDYGVAQAALTKALGRGAAERAQQASK